MGYRVVPSQEAVLDCFKLQSQNVGTVLRYRLGKLWAASRYHLGKLAILRYHLGKLLAVLRYHLGKLLWTILRCHPRKVWTVLSTIWESCGLC
jgi:hypothetical protein